MIKQLFATVLLGLSFAVFAQNPELDPAPEEKVTEALIVKVDPKTGKKEVFKADTTELAKDAETAALLIKKFEKAENKVAAENGKELDAETAVDSWCYWYYPRYQYTNYSYYPYYYTYNSYAYYPYYYSSWGGYHYYYYRWRW